MILLPRKAKYSWSYVVPLVFVLLALPACYTLLKHPRVRTASTEEVADNRCTSCHATNELWAFHHPPNHSVTYPHGWDQYYLVPWWYDAYWHFEPGSAATQPATRQQNSGASNLTDTPGGTVNPAPSNNGQPPGTAEGQPNKGSNNDASSKNRTVEQDAKQKEAPREKG